MLISRGTVVVTYSAVSAPSTISSRTAKISLPLFAFSRRNSAKLGDTNCAVLFDIIKTCNLGLIVNKNSLKTC